jgi:two-component system chemotaxis response regulator CheB
VLLEKIKTFANFKLHKNKFKDVAKEDGFPVIGGLPSFDIPKVRNRPIDAICIGSSTGGTVALTEIIPKLRKDIGVPIFVVQHMPKMYTKSFASRLNSLSEVEVVEGENGDSVVPNKVYIAPGGRQMRVCGGKIVVDDCDPENAHKPSVDVLFRSMKVEYRDKILAVILTGMGSDGASGIAEIKDAGGVTVAQDEDSCVVFGMPGSAIKTGKIDRIIPLNKIAHFINDAAEYLKGY